MAEFKTFTARARDDGTWDVTVDGAKYHIKSKDEFERLLEEIGA